MTSTRLFKILPVVFVMVVGALLAGSAPAVAKDSDRGEQWEFYIPIKYYGTNSFTADGGSTVDINGDIGWGFGFGYNLSSKMNLGFEFTWSDTSYDVNFNADSDGDTIPDTNFTSGGTLEASTGQFTAQFNFTDSTITPFVTAGLGWTYVDSNIPAGPPETWCWWDPFYGYICSSWQSTYADTGFSYSAGVGLRAEVSDTFYLEGAYNWLWIDYDSRGTTDIDGYRFDMGWRF